MSGRRAGCPAALPGRGGRGSPPSERIAAVPEFSRKRRPREIPPMGERLAQRLFAVAGKPSWPGASQIERRPARARPAVNRRSGNGGAFGGRVDEDVPALRAWCVRAFFCYAAPWAWAPAPRAWCAPPRVPPSAVETVPAPRVARPSTGEDAATFSAAGPMKMSLRRARGAPHQGFRPAPWKPSLRRAWCAPPRVPPGAVETIPALRAWCAPPRVPPSAVETVPAPRVARPSTGEDAATFSAAGPMKMSLRRARGAPHQGFRPAPWKPSLRRAWRVRQPAKRPVER